MLSFWQTALLCLAAIVGPMLVLWGISLRKRDVSIVDIFWGLGFAIVIWRALSLHWPPTPRGWLLAALTTIWGVRLAGYLIWRNHGRGEDPRYAKMREKHGPRFAWISLFTVFLLQAAILWFVAMPLYAAATIHSSKPLGVIDALGVLLWSVGLFFEAVGDWQLARFRSKPENRGQVMDRGLWRFTRHPNYFGDACVWFGLYTIAAAGGAWWTIASPIAMLVLLLKFSGVSLTESSIVDRRPAYAAYQKRTNAFFPGPPKQA